MIDIQPILQYGTQIEQLGMPHSSLVDILMTCLLGFIILAATITGVFTIKGKHALVLFVLLIIPIVIAINTNNDLIESRNNITQLKNDRDSYYNSIITYATCEELRLYNLDVLQNEYDEYVEDKAEWSERLYYTKCEIPLREEVMKLK